jgi:hypothetical protein
MKPPWITAVLALSLLDAGADAQQASPYITEIDGRLNKEAIPMVTAIWGRFAQVHTLEERRPGLSRDLLINIVGLNDAAADAFIDYARESVYRQRRFSSDLTAKTCERRSELASRDALLAALLENRMQRELDKRTWIIGLERVLDEENVQRVIKWADDMRANMTMSSGDLERMFEVESVDPQAILERMCSQP